MMDLKREQSINYWMQVYSLKSEDGNWLKNVLLIIIHMRF